MEETKKSAGKKSGVEKTGTRNVLVVYCGPSVKGVARQYTVYAGALPEALENFLREHPAARGLVVSVERFAQVRKALNDSGTAEAMLYRKVRAEL